MIDVVYSTNDAGQGSIIGGVEMCAGACRFPAGKRYAFFYGISKIRRTTAKDKKRAINGGTTLGQLPSRGILRPT